jgi:hypothetical protein
MFAPTYRMTGPAIIGSDNLSHSYVRRDPIAVPGLGHGRREPSSVAIEPRATGFSKPPCQSGCGGSGAGEANL